MTTEELRIEIHKRLDNLPDKALPDFLEYLRHLISTQPVSVNIENFKNLLITFLIRTQLF